MDLALNNLQRLICHKTQRTKPNHKPLIYIQFKWQTILFDPYIGPYQVPSLRATEALRVTALKEYSTFPKAPALLKPYYEI